LVHYLVDEFQWCLGCCFKQLFCIVVANWSGPIYSTKIGVLTHATKIEIKQKELKQGTNP
jgi:hypothetical protein